MSAKNAASDAIRASIRQYKQLAEYADMLEKVGSLEDAETQANQAANAARAELAKAKDQIAKARKDLAAIELQGIRMPWTNT